MPPEPLTSTPKPLLVLPDRAAKSVSPDQIQGISLVAGGVSDLPDQEMSLGGYLLWKDSPPPPPPPLGNGGVFPSWVVTVVRCPYWCTVAVLVSLVGGVESYFSRVRVFPHQAAYCGQVLLPGSACPPQYFSTEERNLTCRKRELPLIAYC